MEEKRQKSILILKAHEDICKNEMGLIEHHFGLLGMIAVSERISSKLELFSLLEKYTEQNIQFDYLYLCTHGDKDGFDIKMDGKEEDMYWSSFSQMLCESNILNEDAILLLACCKGGMFKVTIDIMAVCNKINFVCGVKWNVSPWDITTGFVVFIHNIEVKNAQPSYAAEKASLATDYTFVCYDRDEVEINPTYDTRRFALFQELNWVNYRGEWIETDEQIIENVGPDVVNSLMPKKLEKPPTGERIANQVV